MDTFNQPITLLSATDSQMVGAVVDTGSTFTIVPAPVLKRRGVIPQRSVTLRLVTDALEERAIGWVTAQSDGPEENIIRVFGGLDSPAVIGTMTLETFLLAVDSVDQRYDPRGNSRAVVNNA